MKLFVNAKEIEPLKFALRNCKTADPDMRARQMALLERVVLCEQLQGNIDRADQPK